MSRTNASSFRVTLVGAVPKIAAGKGPEPVEALRQQIVHVPANPANHDLREDGWRRKIVIREQTHPQDVDSQCDVLHRPGSAQARSYRLLRHRLLGGSNPRVIVVTSPEPAEGKTTCAVNLALAIAEEAMVRVLLVEANPVRPSFAQWFHLQHLSSLNAWTAQGMDGTLPIAVANVAGTRLDVAASSSGSQGLDRMFFGVALGDLRDAYDYVIIDTPSVLESADANVATERADGVIVTTRAMQSRRGPLKQSIEQLRPATILGVVVLDA